MTTRTETVIPAAERWGFLRDRIERERGELVDQLRSSTREHAEPSATTGQGETEHVSSEIEQRVQAVLDAAAAARLMELDDALRRIDDATYGYCEHCGEPIPIARIEALPYVRLCLECQSADDKRRRPRHR